MRAYAAVLSARFRTLLQYRAAALAGLATQIFWGLIRMMVMLAFYESARGSVPMTWPQTLAYIWLGQAFFAMFPLRVDAAVAGMIRTGAVGYELLRPVDLYTFWYSRAIADRVAPAALRAGPILLVAGVAGWICWPGPASFMAGVVSIAAAALLSASIAMIMTLTMFYTISGRGVGPLIAMAAYLLGGMIIPLPLFPDAVQGFLNVLPFRGLIDVPFRILTGHIPPAAAVVEIGLQIIWTVGLILFGRLMLRRSIHRLVIQGG